MKYIITTILISFSVNLFACLCNPRTLEEDIQENNLIFSGRVIFQDGFLNTIVVTNIWKGEIKDTITLRLGTTSCHRTNLELSKEYLIFLTDLSSAIHNCSRTIELKFSQDIDRLNEIFKNIHPKIINCLSVNEINFLNNVLVNSNHSTVKDLQNDSTYFVFKDWNNKGYKVMSISEFIKFDHFGMIPLLVELKSKNAKYKLYAFRYWRVDFIKQKKYLRAFKKQMKKWL